MTPMKQLHIDFDEIQKAMEDTARDAFDYFLDRETGEVVILSEDIMNKARAVLEESFDEDMADFDGVEFDEEQEIPEWMEDEIELALDIFLDNEDRYVRIPERSPLQGYAAMREFTEGLENIQLKNELLMILDGKGVFRRFKDTLELYPKERKQWYGFNAKLSKKEIMEWLGYIGIERETIRERQQRAN